MSHNSSRQQQNQQNVIPENYFVHKLNESNRTAEAVHEILEKLVKKGGKILYMKYIRSQIKPYASRTLARELVMNASWAAFPLDSNVFDATPDDDLELPLIDEWAGGVLPVRGSAASGLRNSITPVREIKKPPTTSHRPRTQLEQGSRDDKQTPLLTGRSISQVVRAKTKTPTKPKAKPQLTEAQIITKVFDEARKKTNVTMKAVTVDSDFSVIQIQEPKGLPPALIVPKVATKKASSKPPKTAGNIPRITRPVVTQQREAKQQKKRRNQTRLIEPDMPVFDEEVAEISFSDRFVCAPGVTFKDGSTVKSRPQIVNNEQMTRNQYEQYLEEMKRDGDADRNGSN